MNRFSVPFLCHYVMEIVFMGTGTSQGVPMIAHDAPELDLENPRNWRTRSSAHIVMGERHVQIDAGPEFRLQCVHNNIAWIDEFILTHGHADHIMGMDDLRRFIDMRGGMALPVYGNADGLRRVREVFPYAIRPIPQFKGYPAFSLLEMPPVLELPGGNIRSFTLPHGLHSVLGLVFEEAGSGHRIGYFTDCKEVPDSAIEAAKGADIVVLDALRPAPHPTHMNIDEAVAAALRIGARETYLTHMTYHVDYERESRRLPPGIFFAFDGLRRVAGA